jgi:hypothetical protein
MARWCAQNEQRARGLALANVPSVRLSLVTRGLGGVPLSTVHRFNSYARVTMERLAVVTLCTTVSKTARRRTVVAPCRSSADQPLLLLALVYNTRVNLR